MKNAIRIWYIILQLMSNVVLLLKKLYIIYGFKMCMSLVNLLKKTMKLNFIITTNNCGSHFNTQFFFGFLHQFCEIFNQQIQNLVGNTPLVTLKSEFWNWFKKLFNKLCWLKLTLVLGAIMVTHIIANVTNA